jgi:hypothetical protein
MHGTFCPTFIAKDMPSRPKFALKLARRTTDADDGENRFHEALFVAEFSAACRHRRGNAMRRSVILAALLLFAVGCSSTETEHKPDWQQTAEFMTDSPSTFLNRTDDAFSNNK